MKWVALVVVVAGCASSPAVMLVTDARIDGYDLVIEQCPATGWRSCKTTRERLPLVNPQRRALPAMTPDRESRYRRIGIARTELVACTQEQALHGTVAVELVLGANGELTTVEPARLADCIRAALGAEPFPVSLPETRIEFTIVAPDVAP